jgi:hypothetical protein
MVRHVRQAPTGGCRDRVLEGRPHAQVQLGATESGQPIVERAPHELVREAVGRRGGGERLDHPAAHGFVERREQPALVDLDSPAHDVERELRSGHGGSLEDLRGRRVQA